MQVIKKHLTSKDTLHYGPTEDTEMDEDPLPKTSAVEETSLQPDVNIPKHNVASVDIENSVSWISCLTPNRDKSR